MIKANFLWKPKSRTGIKLVAGYMVPLFVAFVIRLMTLGDFAGRAPLVLLSFPWILLPGLWFSTSPNSMIEHYPREMMAFWALSVILNITFLYVVGYTFDRIRAYFVKPR